MLLRMWFGDASGSADRYVSVTGQAGFIGYHPRQGVPEAGHGVAVLMTLEPFYADGQQTWNFTYVADVVDANRTLLTDGSVDRDVVNIGSSDTISIQELAGVVRDGGAPELEIEYEAAREADAQHTYASVEKAGETIGYEPSRTITKRVGEFIEWYEANREWYEPLVRKS